MSDEPQIPNEIANRVIARVAELGTSFRAASLKAGLNETFIRDLVVRNRSPTASAIHKIADALGVSPGWLLTGEGMSETANVTVPIVGKVGAGPDGEVIFANVDGELERIPLPAGSRDTDRGLEVAGDSMRGIANDGWLIFYDSDACLPPEALYGELCVVWCDDGRTLVKFLQQGRGRGLFDLESINAPTMRDVPVRSASPVTSIVPRRSAARWLKTHTAANPTDIPKSQA